MRYSSYIILVSIIILLHSFMPSITCNFFVSSSGRQTSCALVPGVQTCALPIYRQGGIDLSPQRRALAYVFQDYALFPHLTVVQNIAFGLQQGLTNPRRNLRHEGVSRWLQAFRLESVANQYPDQL